MRVHVQLEKVVLWTRVMGLKDSTCDLPVRVLLWDGWGQADTPADERRLQTMLGGVPLKPSPYSEPSTPRVGTPDGRGVAGGGPASASASPRRQEEGLEGLVIDPARMDLEQAPLLVGECRSTLNNLFHPKLFAEVRERENG